MLFPSRNLSGVTTVPDETSATAGEPRLDIRQSHLVCIACKETKPQGGELWFVVANNWRSRQDSNLQPAE